MPPVLGPASPSPTRLKSWAGARATARVAVAHGQDRQLRAGHALLDDDGAAGVAEARAGELRLHVVLGLDERVADEHALAGGEAVGLHDPRPRQRPQELERRLDLGERAVAGGRHAGGGHDLLHPRLRPLEPGAVGAGAVHGHARGPQPVGQAVDERRLRADHDEVDVELLGRRRRRPRDAGVPRRDHHLGGAGEHVGQGVLPPPADAARRRPSSLQRHGLEALGADADVADRHVRRARTRNST